jgi:hypothetical protein
MGAATTSAAPTPVAPQRPAGRNGLAAMWYAVFAVYAGGVAAFSGPGLDRWWGIWAAGGYAAAAALAWCWRSRGRHAALAASLAGALVAPVVWLATQAPATPDVTVVTHSASLLLHHANPYLPPAQLAHIGVLGYNPYLPVMTVFGLPWALGLHGLAGDPRPWLVAVTLLLLAAAFRTVARPGALRRAAFATASPLIAFPIALGITDPPVLALTCLALGLLTRSAWLAAAGGPAGPAVGSWPGAVTRWAGLARRAWLAVRTRLPSVAVPAWLAAVVVGVACAMKYTAWPALAVLTAMIVARDGARAAVRFAAIAVATTLTLVVALAPASLTAPAALIQNTISFPLGLTAAKSPAQSPLPGHLLATIGPAGHVAAIVLLISAGVAIAASLVIRPPADTAAAARRLALGLALMFALSPATRFGYFAYPLGLLGWIALSRESTTDFV